jgi:hypothetical protein
MRARTGDCKGEKRARSRKKERTNRGRKVYWRNLNIKCHSRWVSKTRRYHTNVAVALMYKAKRKALEKGAW